MFSLKTSELVSRAGVSMQTKLKQWVFLGLAGMAFNLALHYFFYEERGLLTALFNSFVTLVFVVILSYVADLILRKWMQKNKRLGK